jgi:hypothetical protein
LKKKEEGKNNNNNGASRRKKKMKKHPTKTIKIQDSMTYKRFLKCAAMWSQDEQVRSWRDGKVGRNSRGRVQEVRVGGGVSRGRVGSAQTRECKKKDWKGWGRVLL